MYKIFIIYVYPKMWQAILPPSPPPHIHTHIRMFHNLTCTTTSSMGWAKFLLSISWWNTIASLSGVFSENKPPPHPSHKMFRNMTKNNNLLNGLSIKILLSFSWWNTTASLSRFVSAWVEITPPPHLTWDVQEHNNGWQPPLSAERRSSSPSDDGTPPPLCPELSPPASAAAVRSSLPGVGYRQALVGSSTVTSAVVWLMYLHIWR